MSSDQIAKRRRELERRLAELTDASREAFEQAWEAGAEDGTLGVPIRTIPSRDPAAPTPMSHEQELLWLLERSSPGHAYNVPRMVRLRGPLDLGALQRALDALVVRHEALRTTFSVVGEVACQVVNLPRPVPVAMIDLRPLPETDRDAEARRRLRDIAREPFDLERDLQLRATVVRLALDDHVLAILSHHIASDGWSGGIVLRELETLYEGFVTGTQVTLPPLAVQYADFATWQRATLVGKRLDGLLQFWRDHLAGAPTIIDLPADRPRSATPSFEGAARSATAPVKLMTRLRALAREEGTTEFVALFTVFYALIARITGESEIVVATPVAGRTLPELDGVVGLFANTLLLRASFATRPTFRELLHQVREAWLRAYDHQQVPLEAAMLDRGTAVRATAPQIMFMTDDPDRQPFRLAGTEAVPFGVERGATKFDLTLSAKPGATGLRLNMQFRSDLFDTTTIDGILHRYIVLLESAVDSPDTAVAELGIVDDIERAQLLVEWNQTVIPYPREATVYDLVAAQAHSTPDATAVVRNADAVTYRELLERSEKLARRLRAHGVRPGVFVGICMDRNIDMIVGLVGIHAAGGAYVPLDPAYPAQRVAFMLEDTGAPIIVSQAAMIGRLPWLAALASNSHAGTSIVAIDSEGDTSPVERPAQAAGPADIAHVIYTSGSTGKPKGVLIEHRNAVAFITWAQQAFTKEEFAGVLASTSISFDLSIFEIFATLAIGGTIVIAVDALELPRLRSTHPVTLVNTVPSAINELLLADGIPASVRTINLAGEPLAQTLVDALYALPFVERVYDLYGPSETTTYSTSALRSAGGKATIGRPIANTRTYVLDRERQLLPKGLPGELFIGGAGVARGYLGRPDLTAARFLIDPFVADTGAKMYRTGDRVRWTADGQLEYLGRLDTQIKLRGHRIELGEIEDALLRDTDLVQAVAVIRDDPPGAQHLVAYVVPGQGAPPTAAELRGRLRLTLPAVMVPAIIVFLSRLPLTPNGKVDRSALPAPEGAAREVADAFVPPGTPLAQEIADTWVSLLDVAHVGMNDDFFDLGGNSLLAMRMMAQVERIWGRRLPFQSFLEQPTVSRVVEVLRSSAQADEKLGVTVLQANGAGAPLVFAHGDVLGYGWYCRRLAALLGESPLIVLPTFGAQHGESPVSIEAMAAAHIDALRSVVPHGPYRLGGFCHGGMVAYEMARQLAARGEVVERVILVDAFCSNLRFCRLEPAFRLLTRAPTAEATADRRAKLLYALQYRVQRLRQMRKRNLREQLIWVVGVIRRNISRATRPSPALPPMTDDVDGLAMGQDVRTVMAETRAVFTHVARAQRAYMPGAYHGRVDVIWADAAMAARPWLSQGGGWEKVAVDLHCHRVPQTHVGLVAPDGLPNLAARIRECIAEPA